MSETRVIVKIKNNFSIPVKCTSIPCAEFKDLKVNHVIEAHSEAVFQSDSNDRLFCEWRNTDGGFWQMAMTCPKGSSNSACGISPTAGLRMYDPKGTPANFEYILGEDNLADWKSGDENNGDIVDWAKC
jgi:hypothetical protein